MGWLWYSRRRWPYVGVTIDRTTGRVSRLRFARFRSREDGLAWASAMTRGAPRDVRVLYGLQDLREVP